MTFFASQSVRLESNVEAGSNSHGRAAAVRSHDIIIWPLLQNYRRSRAKATAAHPTNERLTNEKRAAFCRSGRTRGGTRPHFALMKRRGGYDSMMLSPSLPTNETNERTYGVGLLFSVPLPHAPRTHTHSTNNWHAWRKYRSHDGLPPSVSTSGEGTCGTGGYYVLKAAHTRGYGEGGEGGP